MKTPELKPCPFCGGKAELEHNIGSSSWFIQCGDCTARNEGWCNRTNGNGKEVYESIIECVETAAEAWNRRATDENAG